jgi:hypothetical protein
MGNTDLYGMALCKVRIGFTDAVVRTHITVPATVDYNEPCIDYDLKNAYITYPDEYEKFTLDGKIIVGDTTITSLEDVIICDLEE